MSTKLLELLNVCHYKGLRLVISIPAEGYLSDIGFLQPLHNTVHASTVDMQTLVSVTVDSNVIQLKLSHAYPLAENYSISHVINELRLDNKEALQR